MTIIVTSLNWVGQTAGLVAIFSLVLHCAFEFLALVDRRYDDVGRMDNAAWIGLACVGLWMACQVGGIGL